MKAIAYWWLSLSLAVLSIVGCGQKVANSIIPSTSVIQEWHIVDLGDSISGGTNQIKFVTTSLGFLIGSYRKEPYTPLLIRTTDGGNTWETINLRPPTTSGIYNFCTVDSSIFFSAGVDVLTNKISLFKSQNQGKTWVRVDGNFPTEGSHALFFLDEQRGITQTVNGLLLTTDGGHNWTTTFKDEPSYRNFDHLLFLDNLVGFAAGGIYSDDSNLSSPVFNQGAVLKTLDGGQTWQKTKSDFGRILSIFFLNSQVGYLATQRQELWRTLNRGESWELVTSTLPVVPASIHFLSQQEGFLVGNGKSGNGIYFTTNAGKTWDNQYLTTQFELTDIAVISTKTIYALGTGGKLLKKNTL